MTLNKPIEFKLKDSLIDDERFGTGEPIAFGLSSGNGSEVRPSVLLFEIDSTIRKSILNSLPTYYRIYEAEYANEGMAMAKDINPDIIIGSLDSNDLGALSNWLRLKSNRNTSHIPIILIIEKFTDKLQLQGLRNGVDAFITIPIKKDVIHARIQNLIASRKTIKEKMIRDANDTDSNLNVHNDEKFAERLIDLIQTNISNSNFDVNQLSVEMGMSRMQLYRKTKGILDIKPNDLVKKLRIMRAVQLIEKTDLRINEIMDETGFESRSAFVFNFKRLTGSTPSGYLKNKRITLKKELADLLSDII